MRHFNITVNGIGYQVSVEELNGAPVAVAPVAVPVAAPVAAPVATPVAAPVAAAPAAAPVAAPMAGGEKINSPMPGTIMDVRCAVGTTVKKGETLLILEAMKMENEIICPFDGTVQQVLVAKGATVNSGDVLVVIG